MALEIRDLYHTHFAKALSFDSLNSKLQERGMWNSYRFYCQYSREI